jgi:transmembrane sensor
MNQFALRAFLEKLSSGNYNKDEYSVFTDWVENASRDEYDAMLQIWEDVVEKKEIYDPVDLGLLQNIERGLDRLDEFNSNIKQLDTQKTKSTTIWRRIAVAASILTVIGTGYYFVHFSQRTQRSIVNKPLKSDVTPGKNKATLTLANGKRIVLSDAIQGKIAEDAGVRIAKTANGQVVYTVVGDHASSLNQFNTLTTAKGETYKIILPDGTEVWLNAASSLTYPTSFPGKIRKVELNGEGYFEVAKNKKKPFIVNANGAEIKVLGTHFNVSAYPDDRTIIATLVEGSIQMSHDHNVALIKPGEQGITATGQSDILLQNADTEQVLAWTNGHFSFKDESIKDVMKLASRWYNVDVEYLDNNIKQKKLRGTVSRYKNISELLDNIAFTSGLHYRIEGRKVLLMK